MSTQQLQDQLNTLQSEVDGLKRISELPNRVTADGTEKIAVEVLGTEYKMDASVFFGDGGKTVDGDYTLQEKDRGLNIYITGASRTLTIPASLGWARTNDCKVMFEQAGFTINDAAVTANYPQTVQDVAKSIFRIFKTGTDEFNVTQEGAASGGSGVSDHGALTGLADDDHPHYLTEARHDALPSDNPHGVTANQVGLGNVDNTSDADKPVSTAQQAALDAKQDTLVSGTNIKTVNGTSLLGSGDVVISGGSVASRTGTNILFDGDNVSNSATYLTSGNLTLDATGAVYGKVAVTYCDRYTPSISGLTYRKIGDFDNTKVNVLSFQYLTDYVELRVGHIEVLEAPALVAAPLDTEISLTWLAVTGADNYVIERAEDAGFTVSLTEVYSGATTNYTDTGLTNGTTYYYRGKSQGAGFLESDFGTTVSETPVASTDFTTNLVAAYQFENNLNDYTGNHNATGVNNINYAGGVVNNGLLLAGDDSWLEIADSDDFSFGAGAFSISLWFNFDSFASAGNAFVSKRDGGSQLEYYIFYNNNTNNLIVVLYTDASNYIIHSSAFTPTLSQDYHLAVTSDGTLAGSRVYLDASNISAFTETGTYTGITNGTAQVKIGASGGTETTSDIDATLDEVYFWKGRQLSPAEVTELHDKQALGQTVLP